MSFCGLNRPNVLLLALKQAEDGDGVIVVPRALARDVAKYAHRELANDKAGRRKLYEALGKELDDTVL